MVTPPLLEIPQSKINLNTKLLAIAIKATVHKQMIVCFLYIPPKNAMDKSELNKLIAQPSKPFLILGDVNGYNTIWGSKERNQKAEYLKK